MRRKRSELIHFAATMRHMRASLAIDQQAMAIRLGTSARTLSDWENGYATPVAEKRVHFVYAINGVAPAYTETLAGLLGISDHPAVGPLLEPDAPEEAAPTAALAAQAPIASAPPAPQPAPRPTRDELRAALDRVLRDAADVVDVRASDLRKGIRAVLGALAGSGSSMEDVLEALEIKARTGVDPGS